MVRLTKTWKSNSSWEGFFLLKIYHFFVEKVSYNPLVLGLGGHKTQKNNTPPYYGVQVGCVGAEKNQITNSIFLDTLKLWGNSQRELRTLWPL